jgi:hypothetical protein
MHPHAELLGLLYTHPNVLVSRDQDRVRHRSIARQIDQICNDQRVHTFLMALLVQ